MSMRKSKMCFRSSSGLMAQTFFQTSFSSLA